QSHVRCAPTWRNLFAFILSRAGWRRASAPNRTRWLTASVTLRASVAVAQLLSRGVHVDRDLFADDCAERLSCGLPHGWRGIGEHVEKPSNRCARAELSEHLARQLSHGRLGPVEQREQI